MFSCLITCMIVNRFIRPACDYFNAYFVWWGQWVVVPTRQFHLLGSEEVCRARQMRLSGVNCCPLALLNEISIEITCMMINSDKAFS